MQRLLCKVCVEERPFRQRKMNLFISISLAKKRTFVKFTNIKLGGQKRTQNEERLFRRRLWLYKNPRRKWTVQSLSPIARRVMQGLLCWLCWLCKACYARLVMKGLFCKVCYADMQGLCLVCKACYTSYACYARFVMQGLLSLMQGLLC